MLFFADLRIANAQEAPASPSSPTEVSPPAGGVAPPAPGSPAAQPSDLELRYRELEQREAQLEAKLKALETTEAEQDGGAEPGAPLAGYSEKNFFLRDRNDNFVLIPKGRINVDYYHFLNRGDVPKGEVDNGPKDPRLKNGLFIRRARLGMAGTFAKIIDFRVEGEFASLPTPGQYATVTDASLVLNTNQYAQLEAGQFYAPFTLENPTSENYTDFMEKAAVVRFAVPTSRETGAMFLGAAPHNAARYWVGVFDGDGQNVKNLDNNPAFIGRAIFSPLALSPGHAPWMEDVWIGGSFWSQQNKNLGGAAAPSTTGATAGDIASVSTQGGWNLFSPSYANGQNAAGAAIRSHLAPNGTTTKYAFELNVPLFRKFGVRGEFMHESIGLEEYNDTNMAGAPTRTAGKDGRLTGFGGYAEVYVWLGQDVNVDKPGLYQVPHWKGYQEPPLPAWAVMLAARFEHQEFDVKGLPKSVNAMTGQPASDAAVGHYPLDVFELGANLWYTRHTRVMVNYLLNYIGAGSESASSMLAKNLFYKKAEHELLLRWAASL
jgi:hypothetical protein